MTGFLPRTRLEAPSSEDSRRSGDSDRGRPHSTGYRSTKSTYVAAVANKVTPERARSPLKALDGTGIGPPEERTQGHTGGGLETPAATASTAGAECAVLDVDELGRVIGASRSKVHELDARDELPSPIVLGKTRRWVRAEIDAWLLHGAPNRDAWKRLWPGVRKELMRR